MKQNNLKYNTGELHSLRKKSNSNRLKESYQQLYENLVNEIADRRDTYLEYAESEDYEEYIGEYMLKYREMEDLLTYVERTTFG